MKLRDLVIETQIFELRVQIGEVLVESISDYLQTTLAQLRNGKERFVDSEGKPTEEATRLASILSGMKVLSIPNYRNAMTREDIGINPNSAKELSDLLAKIPRDGKLDKLTANVFSAIEKIAPSVYKKKLEEIISIHDADKASREKVINDIEAMSTNINKAYQKIKTVSQAQPAAQTAQ